ncbi:hypothetical protein F2Q69_00010032 [Brassica cretica]|uniref:Uncharacterized protein n=1 Tax=Brassica cretica TaxID=69181 RepID=A0A8S9P2E2_BRACR|nr:hypothetical protein F2Q69_00010032 [Brassica cretica]
MSVRRSGSRGRNLSSCRQESGSRCPAQGSPWQDIVPIVLFSRLVLGSGPIWSRLCRSWTLISSWLLIDEEGMNTRTALPVSFVDGRSRPRRFPDGPFSSLVLSWGEASAMGDQTVPKAPIKRRRSRWFIIEEEDDDGSSSEIRDEELGEIWGLFYNTTK